MENENVQVEENQDLKCKTESSIQQMNFSELFTSYMATYEWHLYKTDRKRLNKHYVSFKKLMGHFVSEIDSEKLWFFLEDRFKKLSKVEMCVNSNVKLHLSDLAMVFKFYGQKFKPDFVNPIPIFQDEMKLFLEQTPDGQELIDTIKKVKIKQEEIRNLKRERRKAKTAAIKIRALKNAPPRNKNDERKKYNELLDNTLNKIKQERKERRAMKRK